MYAVKARYKAHVLFHARISSPCELAITTMFYSDYAIFTFKNDIRTFEVMDGVRKKSIVYTRTSGFI